jgi:hypothetical protein
MLIVCPDGHTANVSHINELLDLEIEMDVCTFIYQTGAFQIISLIPTSYHCSVYSIIN